MNNLRTETNDSNFETKLKSILPPYINPDNFFANNQNYLNIENNLSIESKIKLNLHDLCSYLYVERGKFLIYTSKEILLFYKNLSFKKLFLSHDEKKNQIAFIKRMNNGNFLCLNNNALYIFTIKSKIIINKIIKFETNQHIENAIELDNGTIIALVNQNQFFSIKLKNYKDEKMNYSEFLMNAL